MNKNFNGGVLEVVCGPMFSSKTDTIIGRANRAKYQGKKTYIIKPAIDNRDSVSSIVSRTGKMVDAYSANSSDDMKLVLDKLIKEDEKYLIIIDEVQFFDMGIVDVIEDLLKRGVSIIAAGLDMDYSNKPFPVTSYLLAIAEIVTKLSAVCTMCGYDATTSMRMSGETDTIVVGGADKYEARCRAHHEVFNG